MALETFGLCWREEPTVLDSIPWEYQPAIMLGSVLDACGSSCENLCTIAEH